MHFESQRVNVSAMIAKRDSYTNTHTHILASRAKENCLKKVVSRQNKAKKMCRQRRCGQSTTDDNVKHLLKVKVFLFGAAAAALKRYFFLFILYLLSISFSFAVRIVFIQPAWKINNLRITHAHTHIQTDDCIYLNRLVYFDENCDPAKITTTTTSLSRSL